MQSKTLLQSSTLGVSQPSEESEAALEKGFNQGNSFTQYVSEWKSGNTMIYGIDPSIIIFDDPLNDWISPCQQYHDHKDQATFRTLRNEGLTVEQAQTAMTVMGCSAPKTHVISPGNRETKKKTLPHFHGKRRF